MTNSVPDLEESDCFLVTGSNTTEAHPLIASRVFKAKERGAKLIVIEPRSIHLASYADLYLRPRPGTDVAWLNGMMHIIISQGWQDTDFIQSRTEGFEALREKVMEYPPERVEQITGIPKEDLTAAAEMYAKAAKSTILYAMGITQHTSGTDNVLSICNLAMLTGNIGKRGSGVNPLRGQNNVQGACDLGGLPNVYTGYQSVTDDDVRKKFEEAWGVRLPADVGLTLIEMMNGAHEGRIKGMFIFGENPLLSDPDISHVREGLENLEFLAVQDIFLSETAQIATVVLPGASFAEKDGTFTGTDRRVQRVRKAIEPIGESKPDWRILCELAKAMGGTTFDYSSPEEVFEEIAQLTPIYQGISYSRIENSGGLQWPCRSNDDPGTEFLHKDQFSKGAGTFSPIDFKEPAELPDEQFPLILTTGRGMFQFHTGTLTRNSPTLEGELSEGLMEINPFDAGQLDINNDEMVKVSSRRGEIRIKAQLTHRVDKGIVFIPFHFAESAANMLTNSALDPVAKIPELKVCAVKVDKIQGG